MISYEKLSDTTRRIIHIVLQLILLGLMIAGKTDSFWGGLVGGIFLAIVLQEWAMYLSRKRQKAV